MNKQRLAWVVLAFGLLNAIGGVIGYKVAHSSGSLIAGLTMGILLIICGLGIGKKSILSYFTANFLSAILLLFFSYRLFYTGKIVPSGVMALASLVVFVLLVSTNIKK